MVISYRVIIIIFLIFLIIFYFILKRHCNISVPIYYINIDKSIERRKYIEDEFGRFNIPIKRVKGITPDDISEYQKQQYFSREWCSTNTELELACLLSHTKAIHTSYINGDQYSMIVEDDVVIHRMIDFKKLLRTAPSDWEILQMFTFKHELMYPVTDRSLWSRNIGRYFSAGVYILNRKGMKKILENVYPDTYKNKDYSSLVLNFDFYTGCMAEHLLYKVPVTYTCRDLFFSVKTTDSTIHDDDLPVQENNVNKVMNFFKTYGYRTTNLTI